MWIVIIILSIENLYSLIYSLIQLFGYGGISGYCHSGNVYVYNWGTITNRIMIYIVWVVPLVYVYWPNNTTYWCT
jgi:hypothetical protein